MAKPFIPPNADLMHTWRQGEPVTDSQLAELVVFFEYMLAGAVAMGPTFSLATVALYRELDRAQMQQRHRAFA